MREFLHFWWRVFARSARDSWSLVVPHTFVEIVRTAVVAFAPFVVAFFVGPWLVKDRLMSADNVSDTAIWIVMGLAGLGVIWLALFFLHFFFITPYRIWRDAYNAPRTQLDLAQKQIDALKAQLAAAPAPDFPILDLGYRKEDNKYLETVTVQKGNRTVKRQIGRISVNNKSRTKSAENVSVTLTHYMKDGHSGYITVNGRLLATATNQPYTTIDPLREDDFNLFSTKADGSITHLTLGPFATDLRKQLREGKYRLKITISAKDVESVPRFYLLALADDGKIISRPWKDGDTQHEGPSIRDV